MGPVVWCVETLKIFKVPLCVGPVVCGDFEYFQNSPVCGPCGVGSVLCGDFENFQNSPVCGPCTGDFENFCKKIPVLGNFLEAILEAKV